MRKVTFGGANSLDNFIARPDDSVDWLMWSDEVQQIASEFWQTIDTVIMGRKTYEAAVRAGSGPYPGLKNYVFSRTLKKRATENLKFVNEDAADFVARLKRKSGKGICVIGGGLLARSLFEADLIDEVGLNVHPVLLGSGVPLFHEMTRQINLELIESRVLSKGCALLRYAVRHVANQEVRIA